METNYASMLKSPIGDVTIIADKEAVIEITFSNREIDGLGENSHSKKAAEQLASYFDGSLTEFNFPIKQSGTNFQQEVWRNLLNIPYGETSSYTKFSEQRPLAIRAIATANGKNKVLIVIPCHRIIGIDGKLVGYAGELWRKKWLLQHEIDVANKGQTTLKF